MSVSLRGKQCPVCEEWYADWATRCPVCGVALVHAERDDRPGENQVAIDEASALSRSRVDDIDILTLPEDEQLVYELAEWSLSMRSEVAAALADAGVPHGWDGTDLLVHLDDEDEVDEICERIEAEFGRAPAPSAGDPDPADAPSWPEGTELLEYDLAPWSDSLRRALLAQLTLAGVASRTEGTTVVVAADDEAEVEAVIDRVSDTSALTGPLDVGDEADEDLDADDPSYTAMSNLFLAADRLRHDREDREGTRLVSETVDDLDAEAPPFGVDLAAWGQVVAAAETLADALADDATGDDAVTEHASALRTLLRPLV